MYFHVWFVTKYRKAILVGEAEHLLKDIFVECRNRHSYEILELEMNVDHVHMLVCAQTKADLAVMIRTIKAVSAREMLMTPGFCAKNIRHFWARRYGFRRVEESRLAYMRCYIRNQKQ